MYNQGKCTLSVCSASTDIALFEQQHAASSRRGTSTCLAHAPCSRAVSRVLPRTTQTSCMQGHVQCAIMHITHDASSHSAWHKHNNPRSMPMRRVGTSGGRAFLTSCIGESAGPTAPALDLLMQRQHRVCKWQKPLRSKTGNLRLQKIPPFAIFC
jgi:hypothetical protein